MPFGASAVASIGEPVSIVPGLSSFTYELTPSNSYRFAWTDVAINRDTNNLVTAVLELFRNGDWCKLRGQESLIFQGFPDVGPVDTICLGILCRLSARWRPLNEPTGRGTIAK